MSRNDSQSGFTLIELLAVVAVIGIVSIMAFPSLRRGSEGLRLNGDGRSISNSVAVAKMRAAAGFTRARVFANRDANTYAIQVWNRQTSTWMMEGGSHALSYGVTFGVGGVTAPPPNTQAVLLQSPDCTDDLGVAIANTSCIVFNSRGIPIDPATNNPTGDNAIYITNGVGVFGTTLTATPLVRLWWSPSSTTAWVKQ